MSINTIEAAEVKHGFNKSEVEPEDVSSKKAYVHRRIEIKEEERRLKRETEDYWFSH